MVRNVALALLRGRPLATHCSDNTNTGEWRTCHPGELYELYWIVSITLTLRKQRRRRWGGHVVRVGEVKFIRGW